MHDFIGAVVCRDHSVIDLQDERLEFMAEIAHRRDARHAGAALERVQRPLQFGDMLLIGALLVPGVERRVRGFEEFRGLLAEDGGDLLRRSRCSGS